MHPCASPADRKVAVCVITYRRPAGIARALRSLAALDVPDGVRLEIVVVDNDDLGSAEPTVAAFAGRSPWPVRYAVEAARGISFARNRAVGLATGADYVAFIDDDEVAEPRWIAELLSTRERFDADVVAGPTLPVYGPTAPHWIAQGQFLAPARPPTGTTIGLAATGNVLFDRRVLERVPGPFAPAFAISGGEDTFLSMQLARSGARLIWCNEAITRESVPANRTRLSWILRRSFRGGNTYALCERIVDPSGTRRAIRFSKGLARAVQGVVGLAVSVLPPSRTRAVRHLCRVALGAGMLLGVLGYRYEEYRFAAGHVTSADGTGLGPGSPGSARRDASGEMDTRRVVPGAGIGGRA